MSSPFKSIDLDILRDFFRLEGWDIADQKGNLPVAFTSPEDDDGHKLTVIIPSDKRTLDYEEMVRLALFVFSEASDLSIETTLEKLAALDGAQTDKLLIFAKTKDTKLPLPFAVQMMEAIKDLLFHGAANEVMRRPFLQGGNQPIARRFIHACNFLQTVPGSFGFQIELSELDLSDPPSKTKRTATADTLDHDVTEFELVVDGASSSIVVPGELHLTKFDDEGFRLSEFVNQGTHFERRVLKKIVSGLKAVKQCELTKSDAPLFEAYNEGGFNGNMCLALANMFTAINSPTIEFKTRWSSKEVILDKSLLNSIAITSASQPYLEKAGKAMQKSVATSEYVVFTGLVTELKHQTKKDNDDQFSRELRVIVDGKDNKGKAHILRVFLQPSEYGRACDAHKSDHWLRMAGQMTKVGGSWYLQDLTKFEVLEKNDH